MTAPPPARNRLRERSTGRYAFDGNFGRMCVCGHDLGTHIQGGDDCINQDIGDGVYCSCIRFRPSRKKAVTA